MAGSYIHILGRHTGTPSIGVTSNLYLRVMEHKEGTLEGFTAAYGCKRLLYFEGHPSRTQDRVCRSNQSGDSSIAVSSGPICGVIAPLE